MVASEEHAPAADARGATLHAITFARERFPIAAPVARARYCHPMKPEHRTKPWPRSVVFGIVSVLAGALVGGVTMLVVVDPASALVFATMGMVAGAVLGFVGVIGAVIGGWLVATRTTSLALRGLGVAVGASVPLSAIAAGLAAETVAAGLYTAGIAASLTISALAPWPGGFARLVADERGFTSEAAPDLAR